MPKVEQLYSIQPFTYTFVTISSAHQKNTNQLTSKHPVLHKRFPWPHIQQLVINSWLFPNHN